MVQPWWSVLTVAICSISTPKSYTVTLPRLEAYAMLAIELGAT